MGQSQVVRVVNITSAMLTLNKGAPQGCVLSLLLHSLFTHDYVARNDSNTIIKFADDTTVVGLITGDDETAYWEEVSDLSVWCQDKNLYLNISKTKELIVDNRTVLQLGGLRTNDLKGSTHTQTAVKKGRQHLFPIRRLKKVGMGPQILLKVLQLTIESILTGCITAWYGN
jgi:hypothetical protein